MANYNIRTRGGAKRYNDRMDKIFEKAKFELPSALNKFYWRNGKVVKRRK